MKKTDRLNVRITPKELALWEMGAQALGLESTSELVRQGVLYFLVASLAEQYPNKFPEMIKLTELIALTELREAYALRETEGDAKP